VCQAIKEYPYRLVGIVFARSLILLYMLIYSEIC